MSLRIGGMGWVTPLGSGVSAVWQRLVEGEEAVAETISNPFGRETYPVFRVPGDATASAPAHPRLRRSSAISRFAAAAGLAALDDAGVKLDLASAERTALIFAISNGGVVYTKRFYHEIVESGPQSASPLLFPETVFNAPASHLAAILGINGASYTLVGDGAVGLLAMKMAEDLMSDPALDRCLVVAAEEADWLLCDACRRWRLLRRTGSITPFEEHARGTILSEGAGAILLDRTSAMTIEKIDAGCNFRRQSEAAACIEQTIMRLKAGDQDLIVASANGTFIDLGEAEALRRQCPGAQCFAPKVLLGDSIGAGAIWQVICAGEALRTQQLPIGRSRINGISNVSSRPPRTDQPLRRAIVSACGLSQQVAGLSLTVQG
jgi:3-oxoacyl-(acyl-carrier-protein) synthase